MLAASRARLLARELNVPLHLLDPDVDRVDRLLEEDAAVGVEELLALQLGGVLELVPLDAQLTDALAHLLLDRVAQVGVDCGQVGFLAIFFFMKGK